MLSEGSGAHVDARALQRRVSTDAFACRHFLLSTAVVQLVREREITEVTGQCSVCHTMLAASLLFSVYYKWELSTGRACAAPPRGTSVSFSTLSLEI